MQTQGFKDYFYPKKPIFKDRKLAPSYDNMVELPKKNNKKDKKKSFKVKDKNILKSKESKLQPLLSILLIS